MAKRLLLVEDELILARAVARLLRREGYDVTLAGSCAEARQATGSFSLGLFDVDLPDGNGVDLAGELASRSVVRRVAFFSGTHHGDRRQDAKLLGPFVEKSHGFPALLRALEQLLSAERAKAAGGGEFNLLESRSPPPSGIRAREESEHD
ncbi:MAG TPA: response regulator [Polyangiaceae bacterium]|jgi:DNA-binding response OmpR family regulator|nr:response regulator [Polyangiaceae bacterium]